LIIHDVSEYVTWNIPPVQFYIQDLLPKEGSLLLYGAPGVKKSWLVQGMAYTLATGDEWLGFRVEQARTLLVNFEISAVSYHWRLRDMSGAYTLPPQMLFESSPNTLYLEIRENFNRFMEDIRPIAPEVVILDCLQGCYGSDENSTQEMSVFLGHMAELKAEFHCSLVIVHHSNKNLFVGSSMDRSRGTTKLPGWVDTVVYMVKQPSGTVQLQFSKTRQSRRELRNMNINFHDYIWEVGGNNAVRTGE